ncbi:MAG: glycosyltransferase family 87 protein [Candidatus Eisenbacteria bacterium]
MNDPAAVGPLRPAARARSVPGQAGRRFFRICRPARPEVWLVAGAFLLSLLLKASMLGAGAPQVEIDDFVLYEGGFVAWFGHAPQQHGYLEVWLVGLTSLATYCARMIGAGQMGELTDVNLVANAYRDFIQSPAGYYHTHRAVILLLDLLTAGVVFLLARRVLGRTRGRLGPALVAVMYLFSYNTFWCLLRARPDPLVSLAAAGGVLLYLKSEARFDGPSFWLAGVCLGLAAGLKLHGACFTLFIALDIVRRRGWREGLGGAALLSAIALSFFFVGDGVLLFDPILYVKGRLLTYYADLSPHIPWGRHLVVMLRGSGWIVLPFMIAGTVMVYRRWRREAKDGQEDLRSVALIGVAWLLLCAAVRPLRAYWMLPVLPLIYIVAVHGLSRLRPVVRGTALAAIALIFGAQSMAEVRLAHTADLDELRQWIVNNIPRESSFYILGDSVARLPQNTEAMHALRAVYEEVGERDREAGMSFTERHAKHWEESTHLRLFDMLDYRSPGYYYFFYDQLPFDRFPQAAPLDSFEFIVVQERYARAADPQVRELLAGRYVKVAEARSEGMQGRGLLHEVYRRGDGVAR